MPIRHARLPADEAAILDFIAALQKYESGFEKNRRTDPDFRHGCPSCRAPGYQHPVLGYTPVPCGCTCHVDGGPA